MSAKKWFSPVKKYPEQRGRFIAARALVLAGAVVVLAAVVIIALGREAKHPVAVIRHNGEIVAKIALSDTEAFEIPITGGDGNLTNLIQVRPGQICVVWADCPDQICVNQGWISNGPKPITCLPNKVVIEIIEGDQDLDAVS